MSTLLTADRTAEEVSIVFSVAEFFNTAFDAHLTFQRNPETNRLLQKWGEDASGESERDLASLKEVVGLAVVRKCGPIWYWG